MTSSARATPPAATATRTTTTAPTGAMTTGAMTTGARLAEQRAVVDDLAARLTHPAALDDDDGPRSRRWWAQSIAHGAAGVAILHAARDRTRENGPLIHRWLSAAIAGEVSAAPGAGAWFGAPAVAFAFAQSAPEGSYRRARAALDHALADIIRNRLDQARRRIDARQRPRLREFDLVNGLAGLGGYLLLQCTSDDAGPSREQSNSLLTHVLTYLVSLTEPVDADDVAATTGPGWWTSDPPSGDPATRAGHSNHGGHSNQGVAHGIAGPLSMLALAGRAGIWVPGQREAMHHIGDWYDRLTHTTDTGHWWPQRLTWNEHTSGIATQLSPGRPSWCYSTPGIARALQLSGIALDDTDRQVRAEHALLAAVTDRAQLAQISDVSLCHGWAGTALTVWCAARDSADPDRAAALTAALPPLTAALTHTSRALPDDAPIGLIQGAAGAAAALHSLTVDHVGEWARCLLLI